MNRGSLYAFEILLIFLGWMILLAIVWNQSSIRTHEMTSTWNMQRLEELALVQSDALLLQHHVNPWNGCAHFDESLRRGIPYVLDETCLHQLDEGKPIEGIFRVSIEKNGVETIFFQKESGERSCVGLRRPGMLFPGTKIIILDVRACDE